MRALVFAALLAPTVAAAEPWRFGAYGGIEPSRPLHTEYMVGGFLSVPVGRRWSLELDGTYRRDLSTSSSLFEFMQDEALVDPDDPIADRTTWTAELAARHVFLEGKTALLHLPAGGFAASAGLGAGARGFASRDGGASTSPSGFAVAGFDVLFGAVFFARLDGRGVVTMRRDDAVNLGAELRLGLGARL